MKCYEIRPFAGEVENRNLLRTKKMVSAEGIEPSTY